MHNFSKFLLSDYIGTFQESLARLTVDSRCFKKVYILATFLKEIFAEILSTMHLEPSLNCTLPRKISQQELGLYTDISWWIEGLGAVVIGTCGTLSNATSIIVLLCTALRASFSSWLLGCLALFDSLFLLSGILEAFRNHLGSVPYHDYAFVEFLFPFRSIVLCCSIYMRVLLALEKYNALVSPTSHQYLHGGLNTLRPYFKSHCVRLIKYVGPIVLLSTIYYVPKWMELHVKEVYVCYGDDILYICPVQNVVRTTKLRKDNDYVLWYLNISNLVVTTIVPTVLLVYLNLKIYINFKYFHRHQLSVNLANNAPIDRQLNASKREKDMVAVSYTHLTLPTNREV